MSSSFRREDNMEIGWAILLIGVAALFAALLLLVNGVVYAELMNSESPPGLGGGRKLSLLHGLLVGGAVVVSVRWVPVRYWSQSDSGPSPILVQSDTGSCLRNRVLPVDADRPDNPDPFYRNTIHNTAIIIIIITTI